MGYKIIHKKQNINNIHKTPEEAIKMASHVISTNIVLKIVDY